MLLKASRPIGSVAQLAALIGLIAVSPVHSSETVISAIGVVEAANCKAKTVQVLGVNFAASDVGSTAAICGGKISVGLSYVSAIGITASSGLVRLTELKTLSSDQYVPGVTPVYLSGSISEARVSTGEAVLSGAVVSYGAGDFRRGSIIEVLGTQPTPRGVLLPTTIRVIEESGLGDAALVADSSIGSGVSKQSSIGSGASLNSSIGSGVSKQSSIGSGVGLNSSIGSGVSKQSSIGSGASLNSSIGSGVQ